MFLIRDSFLAEVRYLNILTISDEYLLIEIHFPLD